MAEEEGNANDRRVTQEVFDKLTDIFRKQKSINFSAAGRRGGVRAKTAKLAYEKGNKRLGMPSIRRILEAEAIGARAVLDETMAKLGGGKETRSKAHNQAIESRAQEGRVVQMVRYSALGGLKHVMNLVQGADILTQAMLRELASIGSSRVKPKATMALLKDISRFGRDFVAIAREAIELEALILGGTGQIVEATEEVSLDQAVARIVATNKILSRLKKEPADSRILREIAASGVMPKFKLVK